MSDQSGTISGAIGLWVNKRSVSHFEIAVAYEVRTQPGGWRLDVTEPGKLVFDVGHERVPVDLEPGDFVLASGDDVFVSLQERRDRSRDREATVVPRKEA